MNVRQHFLCKDLKALEQVLSGIELGRCVFRGQSDVSFQLQTSLARQFSKLDNQALLFKGEEILKKFEQEVVVKQLSEHIYTDSFRFQKESFKNRWLFMAQAQHYGIPTRLMDWTTRWEIAIYFASVDSKCNENKAGQLWVLDKTDLINNPDSVLSDALYKQDTLTFDDTVLFQVATEDRSQQKLSFKRIYQQDGRFLVLPVSDLKTPLEERKEFRDRLTLLKIAPLCKMEMKESLGKRMDIPFFLENINGIKLKNGSYEKIYDDVYFYGNMDDKLKKVVDTIRQS